jgi:hypothetical protein
MTTIVDSDEPSVKQISAPLGSVLTPLAARAASIGGARMHARQYRLADYLDQPHTAAYHFDRDP